jgi:cytochrome c oxidase subunit 2
MPQRPRGRSLFDNSTLAVEDSIAHLFSWSEKIVISSSIGRSNRTECVARTSPPRPRRIRPATSLIVTAVFSLLAFASTSLAETAPGWGKWWLPPNHSTHGGDIDTLFRWIYWITMITFIGVELVLVIFLIKYRRNPNRKKAHFTHGNTRLEMAWTIAPAIILAVLALGSKGVWDKYRYSPMSEDANRAKLLVIGQQFKWNVIYPGPDGKFGKYLLWPKPTDPKWPLDKDGKEVTFQDVPGPASLPYPKAVQAINAYIDSQNPLGKDFTDPDGKDDIYENSLGRAVTIPSGRPIEVQLSSKDVIHDFFLPNFRVKLDAVPGMRGHIYFQVQDGLTTASQRKVTTRDVPIDQLDSVLSAPTGADATIVIDESAPGSEPTKNQDTRSWRYVDSDNATIMRNGMLFGDPDTRKDRIEKLKAAGLKDVRVSIVTESGEWELVCEELCGQGHNTMTAPLIVLSNEEYDAKKWDVPYKAPTTAPAVASAVK